VCRAECESFAVRNCAECFARPASTPQTGEMGESRFALTVSAKAFAAYLPPGSHGESFLAHRNCLHLPTTSAKQVVYLYIPT